MHIPELYIAKKPYHEEPLISDPSGFLRRRFRREDLPKIRDMLQQWFAECIESSGIPETLAEEGLPESVPLYGHASGVGEGGGCSVYLQRTISSMFNAPGRIRAHEIRGAIGDAVLADIHPSFLRDPVAQQRCRDDMPDVFAGLLTASFSHPLNTSRDRAWLSGLAGRLQNPADRQSHRDHDFPDTSEFPDIQSTCGLSIPEGYVINPHAQAPEMHHSAGYSAFGSLELSALWPIYFDLAHSARTSGFVPTTAQQDQTIQNHLPDDQAITVLNHPSFREVTPGPHAMIFTTRSRFHAVMCSFNVEFKGHLFDENRAKKTAWNPPMVSFRKPSDPAQSISLMTEQGNILQTAPVQRSGFDIVFSRFSSRVVDRRLQQNPNLNAQCRHYQLRVRDLVANIDREIGAPAKTKKRKK